MVKITDRKLVTLPVLLEAVQAENVSQLDKWGIQARTPFEWMCYLTEEVGELAQAISEEHYRGAEFEEVRKEAIQVATLALKIAEMYN